MVRLALIGIVAAWSLLADGNDKGGVSPAAIVLPKGPATTTGMSGDYQWTASGNSGSARYSIEMSIPRGTSGHTPRIVMQYDSGSGSGILGLGWKMPVFKVQRGTQSGVPGYLDCPKPYAAATARGRRDEFVDSSGIKLVKVDGGWFTEIQSDFVRYQRLDKGWRADIPDGSHLLLGTDDACQISDGDGRVYTWLPRKHTDVFGNVIDYFYSTDGHQRYLRAIRYGPGEDSRSHGYIVSFHYQDRPDVFEDCRSGFPVVTRKRLVQVNVCIHGEQYATSEKLVVMGVNCDLIRRYDFDYASPSSSNSNSLLTAVTEIGADGVMALPSHRFGYHLGDAQQEQLSETSADRGMLRGSPNGLQGVSNARVQLVDLNGDSLPDFLETNTGVGTPHRAFLNAGVSDGRIRWERPIDVQGDANAWNVDLESDGQLAHLADMDGDGVADLTYQSVAGDQYFFPGTGSVGWGQRVQLSKGRVIPSPFSKESSTRRIDLDGDRRIDLLQSQGNGTSLIATFCSGENRFSNSVVGECPIPSDLGSRLSLLADVNGDGLLDYAKVSEARLQVCSATGFGRFERLRDTPFPGGGSITRTELNSLRLNDLNGDGLADLTLGPLPGNRMRVSLGSGLTMDSNSYSFRPWITIEGLPTALSSAAKAKWADMNGNGTVDFVLLDDMAVDKVQVVDFLHVLGLEAKSGLLTDVENGRGHRIKIDYKSSTEFMVDARQNNAPWTTHLPFPVYLVSKVTERVDGTKDPMTVSFDYRNGFFSRGSGEYRGFESVVKSEVGDDTQETLVTETRFHLGKVFECVKGKSYEEIRRRDTGEIFDRIQTLWCLPPRKLKGMKGDYTFVKQVTRSVFEGQDEPVLVQSEYDHDDYGNLIYASEKGINGGPAEIDILGDESIVRNDYSENLDKWILHMPTRRRLISAGGETLSQTEYFYDDSTFRGDNLGDVETGLLTLQVDLLAYPGASTAEGRMPKRIPTERCKYDRFGNKIVSIGSLGQVDEFGVPQFQRGHIVELEYDSKFFKNVVGETLHVGSNDALTFEARPDFRFDQVTEFVEPSDSVTNYRFDPLGRLEEIAYDDDDPEFPSVRYQYGSGIEVGDQIVNYIDSLMLDQTQSQELDWREQYFWGRRYLDGMGRTLVTVTEAENNPENDKARVVFTGATQFNARGLAARYLNPAFVEREGTRSMDEKLVWDDPFAEGWVGWFDIRGKMVALNGDQAPSNLKRFDALGRLLENRNPDDTVRRKRYRPLVEEDLSETYLAGGTGGPRTVFFDALDRIRSVQEEPRLERNGESVSDRSKWKTSYVYDSTGNLSSIVDSEGNEKRMHYDSLARLRMIEDPDFGVRRYRYDEAGNLRSEIDAKGQSKKYEYDGVGRVKAEYYLDGDQASLRVSYEYDLFPDGKGQLCRVKDQVGTQEFRYDRRGRLHRETRWVKELGANPLTTEYQRNALDDLTRITLPNGETLTYTYNERALPATLSVGSTGSVVSSVAYYPTDRRQSIEYGNGLITKYAFDKNSRLHSHELSSEQGNVIGLTYAYDASSNLLRIVDSVVVDGDETQSVSCSYDDLKRLVGVEYPGGKTISYRYDPIGNLLAQDSAVFPSQNLGEFKYDSHSKPHAPREWNNNLAEYDANGCQIRRGAMSLGWNQEGQLIHCSGPDGTATYRYDFRGERIVREYRPNGSLGSSDWEVYVNRFYEVENNSTRINVFFDGERLASLHLDNYEGVVEKPELRYIHNNHLGSVIARTGATGGQVERVSYFPFGEMRSGKQAFDYGYVGSQPDAVSGLLAFDARYLAGAEGRFISPDPALRVISDPTIVSQALNPYAYSLNSPFGYRDSDGRIWSAAITVGFAAYDTYKWATGSLSNKEYATAMALNGAALVADVATGGQGGGLVVRGGTLTARATNVAVKTAKAVDNANTVYGATNAALHSVREASQGNYLEATGFAVISGLGFKGARKGTKLRGPGSNFTPKITKQLSKRGWTQRRVQTVIDRPVHTSPALNRATGNKATAFFDKNGAYVVRDNVTRDIVQISNRFDPKWVPDPTITNPFNP